MLKQKGRLDLQIDMEAWGSSLLENELPSLDAGKKKIGVGVVFRNRFGAGKHTWHFLKS